MEFDVPGSSRTFWTAVAALSLTAAYLALVTTRYVADYLSRSTDESHLMWAARLDPGNAIYPHNVGRFEWLVRGDVRAAIPWFERATELNPHNPTYWIDLALTRQATGEKGVERDDLLHALNAAPTRADTALQVGNLLLSRGSLEDAMRAFRIVIENDPGLAPQVIQTCWNKQPDIGFLLENVIPRNANETLLEFLISRKEQSAAAAVWAKMYSLQQ